MAADAGTKVNVGFNVQYNKKGTNLQGRATILLRRLERDGVVHGYQIKSNAIESRAADVTSGTATFTARASLQDVTDPLNPIADDGHATLQVTMTDWGRRGRPTRWR